MTSTTGMVRLKTIIVYYYIANIQAVLKLIISAFHYYLATPKSTQLHSRICLTWEHVKWKTSLNLKYEPKISHTVSRLEVCFQLVQPKVSCQQMTWQSWGKG